MARWPVDTRGGNMPYTPFLSDIGKTIGRGIEARGLQQKEQERNRLIQSAYMDQPGAMQQLQAVDPQAAMQVETQKRQRKQAQLSEEDRMRQVYSENKELMDEALKQASRMDTVEEAQSFINDVVQRNSELFKDVKITPLTQERFDQLKKMYAKTDKKAGIKSFQPITLKKIGTDEKMLASPTVDPETGEAKLSSYDVPEGYEISTETPEEKRAADILAAGLKKIQETKGKNEEERYQLTIDRGMEAADAYPVIQRSIDLLDIVETGGFDAAQIKAKQILGIESADEAELTYNLGKAVLSQLKATFGSAFTEAEGERLARLESGLGKSIEGNKRILEQTKRILMRSANRAISSAEKRGETEIADDIRNALEFRLDIEKQKETQSIPTITSEEEYNALPSGSEFIAPDGSHRKKP